MTDAERAWSTRIIDTRARVEARTVRVVDARGVAVWNRR